MARVGVTQHVLLSLAYAYSGMRGISDVTRLPVYAVDEGYMRHYDIIGVLCGIIGCARATVGPNPNPNPNAALCGVPGPLLGVTMMRNPTKT